MSPTVEQAEILDLTKELPECVFFDPEGVKLEGVYADQISAYRAKRVWVEALERSFLLEQNQDFSIAVSALAEHSRFALRCHFTTACARYAFWRLTNHQAPEAQYAIETAHIPRSESHQQDFLQAPDLKSIYEEPAVLSGMTLEHHSRGRFKALIKKIAQHLGM